MHRGLASGGVLPAWRVVEGHLRCDPGRRPHGGRLRQSRDPQPEPGRWRQTQPRSAVVNRPGDGNGVRSGPLQPGSQRAWPAIPLLLGTEATLLLVWHWSGFQHSASRPAINDLASVLLAGAPLLTVVVALGFGWIGRRPTSAPALVELTLVGPALIVVQLTVSHDFLQGLGGLLATPACTAAAAGLVAALNGSPRRGYGLLVCGGVIGFLALALPMAALAVGNLAECPAGCDPLELRGITGGAIVVGVIALVAMTPGFLIGSLLGRRLREPSGQEGA